MVEQACEDGPLGQCPAVSIDVSWENWWEAQLKWPLAAQLALTVVFLTVLEPLFAWAYRKRSGCVRELVNVYVGTNERPEVPRPEVLIVIFLLQIIGSLASVAIWVAHTYRRSTLWATRKTELAIAAVDIITWMVNRLRGQCRATSLWELNGLVDTLTVVPVLQRAIVAEGTESLSDADWLSLHFLRSYSTLFCFARIQETGHLQYNAVMVQMLIQVLFQVYCLLTVMAGTIFTCEVLGDPPLSADSFVESKYGDRISFMQMVYWVMISITTVGYGDFAPKALMSRILTAIFIVIGVAAIFILEMRVSDFVKRRWEGSGTYTPRSKHEKHVVVVLCLSGAASKLSTMVAGFLQEILHSCHDSSAGGWEAPCSWCCMCRKRVKKHGKSSTWPNVVIFSPTNWDEVGTGANGEEQGGSFNDFLRARDLPPAARRRVWFLVGKVSSKADLDRAQVGTSTLTFLISDVNSEYPDEADGQNIFTAVILRNMYPHIRLRVMLLRPESKELAVQSGIPVTRCFSARELKANILAQNVRCHGLVPMITGMLCSADQEDEEYFLRKVDHQASLHAMRQELAKQRAQLQLQQQQQQQQQLGGAEGSSESSSDHSQQGRTSIMPSFVKTCSLTLSNGNSNANSDADARSSPRHSLDSSQKWRARQRSRRGETLEALKGRLQNSETYWCSEKGEYEACDPWMFAYFGGLRRSIHGFELAERYSGLSFGELVHAVFRDAEALVIGVFENGKLQICPQSNKFFVTTGQICLAAADKASTLDRCRLKGRHPEEWRSRILAMSEQTSVKFVQLGAHLEAAKLCAHELQGAFMEPEKKGRLSYSLSWHGNSLQVDDLDEEEMQLSRRKVGKRLADIHQPLESEEPELWDRNLFRRTRSQPELDVLSRRTSQVLQPLSDPGAQRAEKKDSLRLVRELRAGLGDYEELVVLVVCHGDVWQQVRTFVTCLRAEHLPVMQPIVVLVPNNPPNGLLEDCGGRVVVVKGNRLSARVLMTAGVIEASAVVVMTGEVPKRGHFDEPIFKDYQVMLCAQQLECWCGISDREVFTTYELQDSRSVRHLPPLVSKPAMQLQELLDEATRSSIRTSMKDGDTDSEADGDLLCMPTSSAEVLEGEVTAGTGLEESVLFHPRFAAGQVFTPEIWGSMLGRVFYNPAIIELVEALVMPHRRGQAAFPWQIRVPPAYVGLAFSLLVKDMAIGGWDQTCARSDEEGKRSRGRRFSKAGQEMPPSPVKGKNGDVLYRQPLDGPAVPVAIYRSRDDVLNPSGDRFTQAEGTGGHNYSILAPPPRTKLRAEDWVLVIGSHRFGRKAYHMGLLRGSECRPEPPGKQNDDGVASTGASLEHQRRTGLQPQARSSGADGGAPHETPYQGTASPFFLSSNGDPQEDETTQKEAARIDTGKDYDTAESRPPAPEDAMPEPRPLSSEDDGAKDVKP